MYWSADPMMTSENGVRIGHHTRSFQSVQKSQSPANSSIVMSAAAPTMNAALIQKTASHLRSMYLYSLLTSAFSRSNCASASSVSVSDAMPSPSYGRLMANPLAGSGYLNAIGDVWLLRGDGFLPAGPCRLHLRL